MEITMLHRPGHDAAATKDSVRAWISQHTSFAIIDTMAVDAETGGYPFTLFENDSHPMVIFSENRVELENLESKLTAQFAQGIEIRIRKLQAESWQNAWEGSPQSFSTEKFHIILDADPVPPDPGKMVIHLSTDDAFGNGQHATTRACLQLIEKCYGDGNWQSALDLGTGSGILAIALAKLGCHRIVGTEIADELVAAATGNAQRNDVSGQWINCAAPKLTWEPFDVIVSNILIPVLYDLLPQCRQLLGPTGSLILAGFIEKELEDLRDKAAAQGLTLIDRLDVRGWLATRWMITEEQNP